jgi:predicted nucleic acid-binding Zn ribbon protein
VGFGYVHEMTKTIGRPSIWDQHADEMARMYQEEQSSRGEIARHFKTSVQTVTRVLIKHGIVFEDRKRNPNEGRTSEQQAVINARVSAALLGKKRGPYKPVEMHTCEECAVEYEYHVGRTGDRFCSNRCKTAWLGRQTQQNARARYEADPKKCPCGTAIAYEFRHNRQFCSPACRGEFQSKREKDPVNYVTFSCLNCEKEVTRLKNYGKGHSKYCSNKCAQKHTKTKKHYALKDLEIVFDSGYELAFYGICMLLKIPVERYDRQQAVEWSEGCWYAPDFYLPTLECAVEVKGVQDGKDAVRWEAFRLTRGRLAVLDGDILRKMVDHKAYFTELWEAKDAAST